MREAQLEAACVRYAKSKGWLHSKLDPKGNVGVPDHVFFGPHATYEPRPDPYCYVVEFKIGRNEPTPKQLAWAYKYKRLSHGGEPVHVIRTLEEFKELIG